MRSVLPALLPIVTFSAAVIAAIAAVFAPRVARAVAVLATAAIAVLGAWGLVRSLDVGPLVHPVGGWAAPFGIEYTLDPLAGFVAVLVGVIGFLVVIYPTRVGFGIEPGRNVPLHALVLLLLGGLLGVTVAGDLFNLFVSLEIYSIASYSLVALGGPAAAVASFRYLILGTVGSSLYLLGVGFIYFTAGNISMADVGPLLAELSGSPTLAAATALIVIGLGIKMAIFPLHVWLPDAHSHAPPAVAALLAAVQVKVAAYALMRILFDVLPPGYVVDELPVLELLTWFGAAGVVVGSVMAIRQTDLKRMLAHSTVAQLGLIGVGVGLASPLAIIGALLHVVNHAVMKGCLFFVAGSVMEQAGTKKIPAMAGLGPRMPWSMAGFTIAAVSMVGLPPTAGFFSKWYLVTGAVDADRWVIAAVIVGSSVLTLVYFVRVIETIWFRPPVDEEAAAPVREARVGVLVPIGVLAALVVILGLLNLVIVEQVLEPVADQLVG
ncbi:MAG TPA: proton-conducting transporter membrane subunit [Acidimicrobiales bacterium]|nr:proton-conducting transporter membrane subunit [Acidimicrobiales bacterium]